jgi:hypothetical protein
MLPYHLCEQASLFHTLYTKHTYVSHFVINSAVVRSQHICLAFGRKQVRFLVDIPLSGWRFIRLLQINLSTICMGLYKDSTFVAVFINVSLLRHRSDQIFPQNTMVNFTLNAAGRQRSLLCIPYVKLIVAFFILNLETFCLLEVLIYSKFWNDVPKEIFFITCFIYFI